MLFPIGFFNATVHEFTYLCMFFFSVFLFLWVGEGVRMWPSSLLFVLVITSFISRYPWNRSSALLFSSLLSFSHFTLSSLFFITYEIDVMSALSCDQLKITKVSPQSECLPTALHSGITHRHCPDASGADPVSFPLVKTFKN